MNMNFVWNRLEDCKPDNPLSSVVYWDKVKKSYILSTGEYEAIKNNIPDCTHWALVMNPPEDFVDGNNTNPTA